MALQIIIEPVKTEVTVSTTVTSNCKSSFSRRRCRECKHYSHRLNHSNRLTRRYRAVLVQDFRSNAAPTGNNVDLGDTWYDIDDNIFYVRRTVNGVTDWAMQTGSNPTKQTAVHSKKFLQAATWRL